MNANENPAADGAGYGPGLDCVTDLICVHLRFIRGMFSVFASIRGQSGTFDWGGTALGKRLLSDLRKRFIPR
jgi:hypothetical protein